MSGFTPGPWVWTNGSEPIDISTYESPGYYNNPELRGANDEMVVGCDEYWIVGPCLDEAQMVANARLIAAAPDLLKALKAMVAWYAKRDEDSDELCPTHEQEGEVQRALAVIAKASGEAP
jgi:hypothetical protein